MGSTVERLPLDRWFTQAGLDSLPLLIYVYAADGLMITGNAAAEAFWGIPKSAYGHANFFDISTDAAAETVRNFRRAVSERVTVSTRATQIDFTEKDTVWHDMSFVPLCDEQGAVHYVAILCIDVTESTRRQQAIERAEHQIAAQQTRISELEAAKAEIQRQRATIEQLSTPLIDVWRGILLLPMIGALSRDRMRGVVERLLPAISERKTRITIIDMTGISEVDTETARQFLQIRSMVTLLGADCVLAGIGAQVARTLASLELELAGVQVFASLSSALERCVGR